MGRRFCGLVGRSSNASSTVGNVDEPSPDLPNTVAEASLSKPYAGEIVAAQGQDYLERVTGIYDEIGASEWLQNNPLERMEFLESVTDEGSPVNSLYLFKEKTMRVSTRRDRDSYGQRFEWERVYSVSSTAQTQLDAVQMTLVHELGHHVHNTLGNLDPEAFSATLNANRFQGGTTYAKSRVLEYFAESFALYTFYPTELMVKDPDGYGMIEKALGCVGLEVKQRE